MLLHCCIFMDVLVLLLCSETLVINAGKNGETEDLVLLRGCEPRQDAGVAEVCRRRDILYPRDVSATPEARMVSFLTRRDIAIGPINVAQAFCEEWKTTPLHFHLYIPVAVCLERNEEGVITVKTKARHVGRCVQLL